LFLDQAGLKYQYCWESALVALVFAFIIGVLDESIQLVLPNRVFDPQDILFNGFAVTMAIGSSALLTLIRKRYGKSKLNKEN
jgi:VanZ family protein